MEATGFKGFTWFDVRLNQHPYQWVLTFDLVSSRGTLYTALSGEAVG